MFGFHKPKMYRSLDGCCICRAKSSSSRFTDSKRYEKDFRSCFGLSETRSGDICNACVLLVKRWKKLPVGTKKNWNHVSCRLLSSEGVSRSHAYKVVTSLGLGCGCAGRSQPEDRLQTQEDQVHIEESSAQSDQQTAEGAEAQQLSLCSCSPPTSEQRFHACCVCLDSDAHSTTSSASPAQSPSYSHLSDDGSDTELSPGSSRSPVFSFLDLTYWKR
ncbi:unnamed protein product [Tetraodon nigroviridis]|uniref:(spotted green pufferfish) hypothetical protein n=1 Tax=Tetraodon nigroviridis TaxID=99883 RepID=Q4TDA2_TETNG|nr:unnamed protein product [Tetraodon nigroviridis]